jgi:hypothetical protein
VADEYYDNQFSLAKATPVTVTVGAVTDDIDATLARAGTIAGRVSKDNGAPVTGARVFAVRSDGRRAGPFVSDSAGHYEAYGLRPGDWKLAFVGPTRRYVTEYYDNADSLATATAIPVSYGATETIDAALALRP